MHFLRKKMCTRSWVRKAEGRGGSTWLRGARGRVLVQRTRSTLRDETFAVPTPMVLSNGLGRLDSQLGQPNCRSAGKRRSNGFQICGWHGYGRSPDASRRVPCQSRVLSVSIPHGRFAPVRVRNYALKVKVGAFGRPASQALGAHSLSTRHLRSM